MFEVCQLMLVTYFVDGRWSTSERSEETSTTEAKFDGFVQYACCCHSNFVLRGQKGYHQARARKFGWGGDINRLDISNRSSQGKLNIFFPHNFSPLFSPTFFPTFFFPTNFFHQKCSNVIFENKEPTWKFLGNNLSSQFKWGWLYKGHFLPGSLFLKITFQNFWWK